MSVVQENRSVHFVDGCEIEVKASMFVRLDCNRCSRQLLPGDSFSSLRLECDSAVFRSVACRVKVVGRKVQYKLGGKSIRVIVTFVGDGEPDVDAVGWLYI
jgi:hypothetical protein